MLHIVSTVEPVFHTAPDGNLGSFEPMSPSFAYFVLVNSPSVHHHTVVTTGIWKHRPSTVMATCTAMYMRRNTHALRSP